MRYYIDCQQCSDQECFYRTMQKTFQLPEYMGYNLDALWDLLMDQPPMEIVLENARCLIDYLDDYGRMALDLFGDLDRESGYQVLMRW